MVKVPVAALIILPIASLACTALFIYSFRGIHRKASVNIVINDEGAKPVMASQIFGSSERQVIDSYHRVKVSGAIDVRATVGSEVRVEVDAPQSVLPQIMTVSRNGTLRIYTEGTIQLDRRIRVNIITPTLDAVSLSGASHMVVNDVKGDKFSIEATGGSEIEINGNGKSIQANLSGASNAKWHNVAARDVDITLSGASSFEISGASDMAKIEAQGASSVNAENFVSRTADIQAKGASSVACRVIESLRSVASGASQIHYSGTATKVTAESSGASTIERN